MLLSSMRRNRTGIVLLAGLLIGGSAGAGGPASPGFRLWDSAWPKEKKLEIANVAVIGGMAAYGLLFWGYGGHAFQVVNERWFQRDSIHGGADKLGHAFSTYVAAMSFGDVYERWGYDRREASLYGALSGFATFFMIEFGDAFSRHGFSFQDLAADGIGALWGYLRRECPALRGLVDYRVSYWPSWGTWRGYTSDFISDYSGFKYLLAFKGSGIKGLSSTWLRCAEFHLGYYTRGYENQDWCHYGEPHRKVYVGVALNLSDLLKQRNWRKSGTFLEYYQPPFIDLSQGFDLDN